MNTKLISYEEKVLSIVLFASSSERVNDTEYISTSDIKENDSDLYNDYMKSNIT